MDDKTPRAIAHLSEALLLLSCVRDQGDTTDVPIHIGPADTGRTVHVTAKTAEAIADAVDSMNAYLGSETVEDDKLGNALRQAEAATVPGEWSAAAVAQKHPDLYADVTDVFMLLDPIEITDTVIRDREASLADVSQTLDELYGDVPYPYDDEDVPLPHDQEQMDALTAEVEQYLADGEL
jgi:hypothetical protein